LKRPELISGGGTRRYIFRIRNIPVVCQGNAQGEPSMAFDLETAPALLKDKPSAVSLISTL
jgi:hypothetical protein